VKKCLLLLLMLALSAPVFAKGSFSGGGRSSSFSSGRSYSSSSRSYSSPSRSYSSSTYSSVSRSPSVTRSVTTTRTYVGGGYGHPYAMGGMGMGYGYSNGLVTGMILGNLMHPAGTVVYNGSGAYSGNALLYPNGQVVNQQGYLVGNYADGQFTAVPNGGMVAQPAPSVQQAPPQPVVIEDKSAEHFMNFVLCLILLVFLLAIISSI